MTIAAFIPDLMDRSRVTASGVQVVFAGAPAELIGLDAEVILVDLSRPGVLDVLPGITARVVGFASHVDRELLAAARAAGCDEVLARSAFFGRLPQILAGG
jgi:hypothetical protein